MSVFFDEQNIFLTKKIIHKIANYCKKPEQAQIIFMIVEMKARLHKSNAESKLGNLPTDSKIYTPTINYKSKYTSKEIKQVKKNMMTMLSISKVHQ